jgi:hypothetical protein
VDSLAVPSRAQKGAECTAEKGPAPALRPPTQGRCEGLRGLKIKSEEHAIEAKIARADDNAALSN